MMGNPFLISINIEIRKSVAYFKAGMPELRQFCCLTEPP